LKYAILTFGCRVNQADSFDFERDLHACGGVPAPPETADVVVVNTCTVTASADRSARSAIRRIARANPNAHILATGCYATRLPGDLDRLPGVVALLPNDGKQQFTDWLDQYADPEIRAVEPFRHQAPIPGTAGRTAYPLRVQTGCDGSCSYCIVPSTRGVSRSQPLEGVLRQVRRLEAAGYRELWLTGVHLGSYGRDLRPASSLADLLTALDRVPGDVRFRISSLEPMDCTCGIVDFVAGSRRFLPHLHLPFQHVSARMLEMMRRPYSFETWNRLIDHVRDRLPEAAIGGDVIVGFPGETDRDFQALADYLEQASLTHLHVFPYSDRPGTAAAAFPSKVGVAEIRRRADTARRLGRALTDRFVSRMLSTTRNGLTLGDGTLVLTDNYLKVRISPGHSRNVRVRVRLLHADPLRGEVVA
jgi:threonylcarbamoyladenosine tRNA methylthiotransferase MtaB